MILTDPSGKTPEHPIRQRYKIGQEGAKQQRALTESKGSQVLADEVKLPRGGRLDDVIARAGKGAKAMERKTLTAREGGHYVTETGELKEKALTDRLKAIERQVRGHRADLKKLTPEEVAKVELRQAERGYAQFKMPETEHALITIREAPESLFRQIQKRIKEFVGEMEAPKVGIGAIPEETTGGVAQSVARGAIKGGVVAKAVPHRSSWAEYRLCTAQRYCA